MIHISKKIEYSLIALKYIAESKGKFVPAKVISEKFNLPYDFLTKLLQELNRKGILESMQGKSGGYILTRDPDEITVLEIITALDDSASLTNCTSESNDPKAIDLCKRAENCSIRSPMLNLQDQMNLFFKQTSISKL